MAEHCAPDDAEELVRSFWARANARDWSGLAWLLAPTCRYEVPQTREFIANAEGLVDFFATWPPPWRVEIARCVSDGRQVALQVRFEDGGAPQTAVGFYEIESGRIARITEFWPEPYEPPARHSAHVQRG